MAGATAEQPIQAGYQANHQAGSQADNVLWSDALDQLDNRVELASCTSGCDMSGACGCGSDGGGLSLMPTGRGSRFFVGGEYLYLRASPSEAISYLERDLTDLVNTFHQFDFDYDSSFRAYGGCRNCCGEEIRFTFSRFDTGSNFVSPTETSTTQIITPLEQTPVLDGSRVVGTADIDLNDFDLGWSKTIPLGSPLCCDDGCCGSCDDCCDPCCDPCGGWCPAWDLTFTGAFRAVDMSTARTFTTIDASDDVLDIGNTYSKFQGAGARVGMLGRRYFGRRGIASLYIKGDLSLLVGEYEAWQDTTDFSGTVPVAGDSQSISCRHVIPVTEIEAGGTMFVTCNTSITGGYFISAWHDLGFRDQYNFPLQTSYDDANIMAFDGFFLRMETSF
ncbi:hypothetical protein N9N28_12400 [Rubripirellula amarantea]|nr:hypothetical protein [Rubripirellula amarantea]